MEGNKSAMYEQAGRNRGWTMGAREETAVKAAPAATVPSSVPEAPAAVVVREKISVKESDAILVKPVVPVIPEPPVVDMPAMERPEAECQTLAMAYTAMQKWKDIYDPDKGLSRGTIFAELDLPFVGEGACRHE